MSKPRKPSVIAVIENGETRCGLTTAIRGLGGIPYRLHKRAIGEDGRPLHLFENIYEMLRDYSPEPPEQGMTAREENGMGGMHFG